MKDPELWGVAVAVRDQRDTSREKSLLSNKREGTGDRRTWECTTEKAQDRTQDVEERRQAEIEI